MPTNEGFRVEQYGDEKLEILGISDEGPTVLMHGGDCICGTCLIAEEEK